MSFVSESVQETFNLINNLLEWNDYIALVFKHLFFQILICF